MGVSLIISETGDPLHQQNMGSPHIATVLLVILATHQSLASTPKGAATQVVEEINRRMGLYTYTHYANGGFEDGYYRVIEDPSTGTYSYEYDCTGHLWHVLWKSSPQAYEEASNAMGCCFENGYCPSPERWVTFMKDLAEEGTIGVWQAVTELTDLRPGDVLIRDCPCDPGHAMIAMGTPESTDEPGIYRLWISDSTSSPHQICDGDGDDTRVTDPEKGTTGMGTGYIRVEDGMIMDWCMCCNGDHYLPLLAGRPLA